jgi:RHS repeat-associated protein
VAWQSSHEAYGDAQVTSSLGAGRAFNIRFPGQYHDAETGLHYNRFRYYDPEIGRYISADPIGQVGDLNVYRYALANPALLADPQGLIPLYKWRTCNAKEKAECIKYCDEVIGRPFVSCRRRVMALRSIGNRTDIRTLGISCNCKDDGGFCQNNPGKCVLGAAMVLGAACAAALAPEVIVIPVLLGTAAAGS